MPFKKPPRKIFDILPPERYQKELPERKEIIERRFPLPHFPFKKGLLIILLILFIAGFLFYLIFQRATITIWPEAQKVSFKEKIIVDKNVEEYDFLNKTIAGKPLEVEKVVFQEFSSSGKVLKETKAEGIIQVYNGYSTSSQVLVAKTRFVSADGKLFRSLERVTIPGGRYEKGELQPGYLDIKVRADRPGPEYNIRPSTFSIPGFAGTPRYTAFYGKSFQPMAGGFVGEVPQITQKDLEEAERILKERWLEEVESSLKVKVSEEFVLLEEAVRKEMAASIFSAKAEEEGDSFSGEIKGSLKALIFKKSDLQVFIKDFILSEIDQDQKLKEDSLEMTFFPETINLEEGEIILNLDFSATIYSEIKEETLKKELAGKSLAEAKTFLEADAKIVKSEVDLWPFWLKNLPKDLEKIKIGLRIDPHTK